MRRSLAMWHKKRRMSLRQRAIDKPMRIHYLLVDNPRFWYDKGILEASKIVCSKASDLRKGL